MEKQTPKYGLLLNKDIALHRQYFNEMVRLLGVQVIYKAPRGDKSYNLHSEIEGNFYEPKLVGCIFDEHPTQQTLKKMGWVHELQENSSIIHVPYDLEYLQRGALFIVPSGIDNAEGRLFRVTTISNIMVYPASVACEIVPEYKNTFEKASQNFKQQDFNLLIQEEEDYQ